MYIVFTNLEIPVLKNVFFLVAMSNIRQLYAKFHIFILRNCFLGGNFGKLDVLTKIFCMYSNKFSVKKGHKSQNYLPRLEFSGSTAPFSTCGHMLSNATVTVEPKKPWF